MKSTPKTPSTTSKPVEELDQILATLAEELINYEQRMTEAGAPPIRFVYKYSNKAKKAIQSLIDKQVLEGRIDELKQLKPPEGYKDYARLVGRDHCIICGFNAIEFGEYIDDKIMALEGSGKPPAQNKDALQTNNKEEEV